MSTPEGDRYSTQEEQSVRGWGSAIFAAIMLLIIGTLNVIYGIAAVADSSFYVAEERYVFGSLHTWGWITIILGVIEFTAALSLFAGNVYGRVVGIVAATIGAIGALLNVGGPHPWWSLGVFAVCVIVIHGLFVLGEPERT
jgi:hypothetical protein